MGSLDGFPNEVKLSCSNHVLDIQDVTENVSNSGILYLLFLYMHHVDGQDMFNASVKEDRGTMSHNPTGVDSSRLLRKGDICCRC
jgi:hypothetical protein